MVATAVLTPPSSPKQMPRLRSKGLPVDDYIRETVRISKGFEAAPRALHVRATNPSPEGQGNRI